MSKDKDKNKNKDRDRETRAIMTTARHYKQNTWKIRR